MAKLVLFGIMALAAVAPPLSGATIFFSAPVSASGPFDVLVEAQNLFAGRDTSTDMIISYGFNVSVTNPSILSFLGATSGPLFDPAGTAPGTAVFAAASGFGVAPGAAEPLILAALHFKPAGSGPVNIVISSNLSNLFQGLQFVNAPFQESIAGTVPVTVTAVPEPSTLLLIALGGVAWMRRAARSARYRAK